MKRIITLWTGLIPRFMPVKLLSAYLGLLSVPIPAPIRKKHLKINRAAWRDLKSRVVSGGYIERQSLLDSMRFGNAKASFNCCEAIAAYNMLLALRFLNNNHSSHASARMWEMKRGAGLGSFPSVLCDFERRGLVLGGLFGTATDRIISFAADYGLSTGELWGRRITPAAVEAFSREYDAFVLTMYNDADNIFAQVHTVCISRREGSFSVHNAGITGRRFSTLSEALTAAHGGKGKEILLVGVRE